MIADLASCEWDPGSNRSLVDPVAAVARLDIPAPIRAELVEKIRRHRFDDVVSIDWAQIKSDRGVYRYEPAIRNMNFGDGRICRRVTRLKWSADRTPEAAIVYTVGDRSFGYAAACGNLFELTRLPADLPPLAPFLAPAAGSPDELLGGPLGAGSSTTEVPNGINDLGAFEGFSSTSFGTWLPGGFAGYGSIVVTTCECCVPISVAPVPEPAEWALYGFGLATLAAITRRKT